jgi:putative peptide maturation dehydrogenase
VARVRRTVYAFFYYRDSHFFDVGLFLRGTVETVPVKQVLGISILTGEEVPISSQELQALYEIPSNRWVDGDVLGEDIARSLARRGLILLDVEEKPFVELRARDELLAANQWNIYGALCHFMTKWGGVDFRGELGRVGAEMDELPVVPLEALEEFMRRHGDPPATFLSVPGARSVHRLPPPSRDGPFQELLARRRTSRAFDRSTSMTTEELSVVLDTVFGCRGYAPIIPGLVGLRKASPSGGGLHPTEVYPLVTDVEGVEPGIYHYRSEDHSLELLEPVAPDDGVSLATRFMCGQSYFGAAHVTLVLTARFYRSFWKYRKHQRAYAALLMDAAHLSQVHYLVCAELGLGAFVTMAINGADIEERLGLDGVSEGAIAVCGCGKPASESPLDPDFLPYVPGETEIDL